MPFTPSHIAAVLPLSSGRPARRLVPAALVIGSMVPDLPYFVPSRLRPAVLNAALSHSLTGLMSLDLVCGVLIWLSWRLLLQLPLLDLCPAVIRRRLPGPASLVTSWPDQRLVGWAALSVLIGALSHIGWDSFTHPGRWGAEHLAVPSTEIAGRPLASWLQYLSGVLGLVVIAVWVRRQLLRRPAAAEPPRGVLTDTARVLVWRAALVVLAIVAVVVWVLEARAQLRFVNERVVVAIVTRSVSVTGAMLLVYALAHRLIGRRRAAVPGAVSPGDEA